MGTGLGVMFLGLSLLAGAIRIAPFEQGTPTVIAQVGEAVYGGGVVGDVLFYALQAGTMLILVMAANTGFADFPRLASFQAGDSFLPRQMTKRGHRLVYSNGIITLALAAMALVVATQAVVTRLIPLYAIGVFTGFTLSQAGMTRHHLRRREPGWQRGLVINSLGAGLSFVVTVIIAVTKFADGAWMILIVLPVMVWLLLRLNGQYEREAEELERDVPAAVVAPVLRRHVVLVFVDRLDMAAARAIQYGRTHQGAELRAVHRGRRPGGRRAGGGVAAPRASRVPLEVVECSDRRMTRAAVGTVGPSWPTARPRCRCCCPTASSGASGTGSCTTARPTRSSVCLAAAARQRDGGAVPPGLEAPTRHPVDRRAISAAVGVPAWQAGDDEAHVRPPAGTLVPIAEARWRHRHGAGPGALDAAAFPARLADPRAGAAGRPAHRCRWCSWGGALAGIRIGTRSSRRRGPSVCTRPVSGSSTPGIASSADRR